MKDTFQDILQSVYTQPEKTETKPLQPEDLTWDIPLQDASDSAILLHKDAHFGGSFSVMIEYYQNPEAPGIQEDISLDCIEALKDLELQMQENLSDKLLSSQDKAKVLKTRQVYTSLSQLAQETASTPSRALSHLILSEKIPPTKELQELASFGFSAVKPLTALIQNLDFWDPLFPGYGLAPLNAIQALALIKDPSSIPSIFACLKHAEFFSEASIIEALKAFGPLAHNFLKQALHAQPFSQDNLSAALCLQSFQDPQLSLECFQLLKNPSLNLESSLAQHLVLNLHALKDKKPLLKWAQCQKLPSILKEEIDFILSSKNIR